MKFHWRSLLGVSLVSALAVAPLFVLARAKGRLQAPSVAHYFSLGGVTWAEVGVLYVGLAFVLFVLFLCVGAMLLFLSAMIDRVPPPFPRKQANEKGED